MAAGAAEAAEAAVAVVEVGSAQQFEELLRLKTKYAGRRGGRRTRGRRAGGVTGLGGAAARPELSSWSNGGPYLGRGGAPS